MSYYQAWKDEHEPMDKFLDLLAFNALSDRIIDDAFTLNQKYYKDKSRYELVVDRLDKAPFTATATVVYLWVNSIVDGVVLERGPPRVSSSDAIRLLHSKLCELAAGYVPETRTEEFERLEREAFDNI